jgi:hypothetical protein
LLAALSITWYVMRIVAMVQGQDAHLLEALCPIAVIPLFAILKRETIPLASRLEQYGKRAYGLYLTNLIALSVMLAGIKAVMPWVLPQLILLIPALFVIALLGPCWLMSLADRLPNRVVQRYVFG